MIHPKGIPVAKQHPDVVHYGFEQARAFDRELAARHKKDEKR
jgi:hypothetical protein